MNIQSLSICVPAGCPNGCPFCISRMRGASNNDVNDVITLEKQHAIKKRIAYARDNGCNTLLLTGTGEPINNMGYIQTILNLNDELRQPFRHIELQTSGVGLPAKITKLKTMGIETISLSIADITSPKRNRKIMGIDKDIDGSDFVGVSEIIKDHGLNLRISLNMISIYKDFKIRQILDFLHTLEADQVTFRFLEVIGENEWAEWTKENRLARDAFKDLTRQVKHLGTPLEKLPFGQTRYSLEGISTVFDNDCMNRSVKENIKYLILQDNKLFTKWNDRGSLLF